MRREEAHAIRRALDNLIKTIPMASEAEFNAAAAAINDNVAAVRMWRDDREYKRGDIALDPADKTPYWALHEHGPSTGQVHQPSINPTIWTHCHGTSPETARPFVAEGHNPYMTGHYCTEVGAIYRSVHDNNVYAPSVYPAGWEAV